jgi:hypothetical protein
MQGGGIYGNNAVFIRQFIESREPLDVFRVLIHAMQQDHHRIVLLRIVALRQPDHEVAVDIVDRDPFLGFLRPESLSGK